MELVALATGVILSALFVVSALVTGVRYLRRRYVVVSFGNVPAVIEDTGSFAIPVSSDGAGIPLTIEVVLASGAPDGVSRTFRSAATPGRDGDRGNASAPGAGTVRGGSRGTRSDGVLSGEGIRRGLYRPDSCRLVWDDPLALFRVVYTGGDDEAVLRVLPGTDHSDRPEPVSGVSGTHRIDDVSVRRNAELIESRPYYPGDDPRHIHWGMYAHTGELYLRIGEEVPPRVGTVTIALDHTAGATHEILDRLIATAVGLSESIACPNRPVRLALLGPTARFYDDVESARWEWAELAPTCPGGEIALLPEDSATGLVLYVTGGVSRLAPSEWSEETIGIRYGERFEAV
ncbi:MAG: DUF58 domain-containing protein [Alkalispirochaeta sp.]